MNQGKLEVVKQEMARMNVDILGISELRWTGMGEFNLDDHYIYYCVLSFNFLMMSFEAQKFLIFLKSNLPIFFSFVSCAFGLISENPLSNPRW